MGVVDLEGIHHQAELCTTLLAEAQMLVVCGGKWPGQMPEHDVAQFVDECERMQREIERLTLD